MIDDSTPVLAVVFDYGSATPLDIGRAAAGLCDLVFVCEPSSPYVQRSMPVLEHVGAVVPATAGSGVERTLRAVGVTGVIAFADPQLPVAADIAGRLGLPFHAPETVDALVDKHTQRERLAAAGAGAVRSALVEDPGAAAVAVDRVGLPAVLKPRRGSGSRNTVLVRTPGECVDAVAAAFGRGEPALVLEEYLPGDEAVAGSGWGDYVSVESLACGDRIVHLGVTGKPPLAEPFRETGAFFPSTLADDVAERVRSVATAALVALGVRHGVCHTEVKLTPSGPRLIEVNGRLGGYVDDVMSRAAGLSPLRLALAAAVGRAGDVEPARAAAVAYQLFVLPPTWARTVARVDGVEAARALPGVERVELTRGPGDAVDWRAGTDSAVAIVHGLAPDHAALQAVRRALPETLAVDYAG